MKNHLRECLEKEGLILGTRITSTWPMVAETAGATGLYDYIEFLGEYAPYDQYALENLARACELHGMSCIMKVDYASRDFVAQRALASRFSGYSFYRSCKCKRCRRNTPKSKTSISGIWRKTGICESKMVSQ